jgi:hypothetical protein
MMRAVGNVAGRQVRDHVEHDRAVGARAGHVRRPDGVPVHRRIVARGYVERGDDRLGKHPPERVDERDTLDAERLHVGKDRLACLLDGQHRRPRVRKTAAFV